MYWLTCSLLCCSNAVSFAEAKATSTDERPRRTVASVAEDEAIQTAITELATRNVDAKKFEPRSRGPMTYEKLREISDPLLYRQKKFRNALSGHTFWRVALSPPSKPYNPGEPVAITLRATWIVYVDASSGRVLYVEAPSK